MIALTVDNTTGRNSESFLRWRPKDTKQCTVCHESANGPSVAERPMYKGIDTKGLTATNPAMDWDYVDQIRQTWKGKFIIKGIDTREDARCAVEHGIDGILVSNHGGRATENLRATFETLPEVVAAVTGAFPSSLTAASAAAPMSSRAWRWAPRPWASAGPSCGAWAPSARMASTASSRSCRAN